VVNELRIPTSACKGCYKLHEITDAGDEHKRFLCPCTGRRFVLKEEWIIDDQHGSSDEYVDKYKEELEGGVT